MQRDPNLPIGTEIKNRVGIYFDYNAPIVTNYAVNTLYDAPDEIIPVEIEWTTSDVTCIENNNGNIELSIESGTPPYSYAWSNGSTAQNQYDLAPGNYSVTVSDSLQQSASAQIEVGENRVHPAPVLGEITGPLSVLANNSYSYEVEHSSGSSYTWIVQGGELINAANNVAEIMWFEGPQGELEITEKDLNGCMGNTEQTITINTVGIIENSMKGLSVYPNPSDGLLNVSLPNLEGEVSIQLFDVQGQLVLHHSTNDNQTSLNIAHLDAGVYLLSIKHDGESAMLRLIVN
ncbi:MAG: T9SS type A sorting domain-containing protein, partial [Salibacteraceae bacterium]